MAEHQHHERGSSSGSGSGSGSSSSSSDGVGSGRLRWAGAKVVRTDAELALPRVVAELRAGGASVVELSTLAGEEALADAAADADLVLTCYAPVTARTIARAQASGGRLRGIVKFGVGIDSIDVDAAIDAGVPVANVPSYSDRTVAEFAAMLIVSLARRLPRTLAQTTGAGTGTGAGADAGPPTCGCGGARAAPAPDAPPCIHWFWPNSAAVRGRDLAGSVLGVVGFGKIGRALARICVAGFGMQALFFDPHVSEDEARGTGARKAASLDDVLRAADVVSLHAVLTPRTHMLIGARELALLRPGTILVNTARGALVDEAALVQAVLDGRLGGLGVDVFAAEPIARSPLRALVGHPDVILTPHVAFFTDEAMERLEDETLERCIEILDGRPVSILSDDPRLRRQTHNVVHLTPASST